MGNLIVNFMYPGLKCMILAEVRLFEALVWSTVLSLAVVSPPAVCEAHSTVVWREGGSTWRRSRSVFNVKCKRFLLYIAFQAILSVKASDV